MYDLLWKMIFVTCEMLHFAVDQKILTHSKPYFILHDMIDW